MGGLIVCIQQIQSVQLQNVLFTADLVLERLLVIDFIVHCIRNRLLQEASPKLVISQKLRNQAVILAGQ